MQLPEFVAPPFSHSDFTDIIDVRSPSEFEDDHIPGAITLPVLSDSERVKVGTIFNGDSFTARRMGASLISKNIHQHLDGPLASKDRDFAPLIYCWRGHIRSNSMALILKTIGWRARVLQGGYKAWRKWLIDDLDHMTAQKTPELIVLSGLTGCGKTRLLHALKKQGAQTLDLEGLANHKGSILGEASQGHQPTQKLFETRLWDDFRHYDPSRPVFTEGESNRIGKIHLPGTLWQRLGSGRVVLIDLPLTERARFLADDYPHFVNEPDKLKAKLDGLRRLRGHAQVDQWHSQIDTREWPVFLTSILENHYDKVYRTPGSDDSVYQSPEFTLELPLFSPTVFDDYATKLIERYDKSLISH